MTLPKGWKRGGGGGTGGPSSNKRNVAIGILSIVIIIAVVVVLAVLAMNADTNRMNELLDAGCIQVSGSGASAIWECPPGVE